MRPATGSGILVFSVSTLVLFSTVEIRIWKALSDRWSPDH
jgi:hypothetical protein